MKSGNTKGNEPWTYIGRTDAKAEAPIPWLKAGGEEGNRGWDHWMASSTQWTWVWASSGRLVKGRETWRAAVPEVAKCQTWLSDWTTIKGRITKREGVMTVFWDHTASVSTTSWLYDPGQSISLRLTFHTCKRGDHNCVIVFPVVMYGCESCTIKKAERWRIDAFELWCWRRLLRVHWTARRSNQTILEEMSPQYSLEGLMLKLKLQYFGYLMQRTDLLEKTLMWGRIEGRRKRGCQGMRWLDGPIDWMDMYLSELWQFRLNREAWRAAVHGVAKSWTWQSNWTELKESACNAGASGGMGSIPGWGRSPGEGNGHPLQ